MMVVNPASGNWELMSSDGKVIVFDTAILAWEWLPLLGQGRPFLSDDKSLSVTFLELSRILPNRARVVSPYFPEERQPWKKHTIWSDWWK